MPRTSGKSPLVAPLSRSSAACSLIQSLRSFSVHQCDITDEAVERALLHLVAEESVH